MLFTARYNPAETPWSELQKSEAVLTPSCLMPRLLAIISTRQCSVLIQWTMEHQLCWIKWTDSSRKCSPLINQQRGLLCWRIRHLRMVSPLCMRVNVNGFESYIFLRCKVKACHARPHYSPLDWAIFSWYNYSRKLPFLKLNLFSSS